MQLCAKYIKPSVLKIKEVVSLKKKCLLYSCLLIVCLEVRRLMDICKPSVLNAGELVHINSDKYALNSIRQKLYVLMKSNV